MSNTLSLVTRLRAMTDSELIAAMRARGVSSHGIKDFFDLAEAFLAPASIQQMLTRLDRATLAVLAAISELTADSAAPTAAQVAAALGELAGDGQTAAAVASVGERAAIASQLLLLEPETSGYQEYDGVRDQLRAWPALGLPGLAELAVTLPPAALEPVPDVDRRFVDRLAADRAFAAITATTELLADLEREPARELAKGGIALPDTKRLATAMAIDLESVATFVTVAERAGLLARESGSIMITEAGRAWLLETSKARWGSLAGSWLGRLPADIRGLLGERAHALWGHGLRGYIDWLYPAGGDWMDDRISTYTRDAELLGVTANHAPSTPGSALLAAGITAAETAMAELLPQEVERVYLQHDLSIVAPGPLTPAVDARLRTLADVESRALASSYRVSTSSVNRAMASGETKATLLEFLSTISLTGIPQPLDYLIGEAASRYGQVRAGSIDGDSDQNSYIRSDDEQVLGTILVDQALSSLGLKRVSSTRAESRFPLDVVFWSVSDARYPVAAEDSKGMIVALKRQRTARAQSAGSVDPLLSLIERLRLGGEPEPQATGQAWLLRQLDVAIKARVGLTVSVRMPNGSIVDYQLEPTSVGGGRLRARDDKSQIERTLPLASIAALGPAQPKP